MKKNDLVGTKMRTIENFPRDGFYFPDITEIIDIQPDLFWRIINSLSEQVKHLNVDKIVCVESFGYLFGVPIAQKIGCNFVIARKAGKLPNKCVSQNYNMCYDNNRVMEIQVESIYENEKILIVDDFYASGSTYMAIASMVNRLNGRLVGGAFAVEIPELNCKHSALNIPTSQIYSFCKIKFDKKTKTWLIYENC